MSDAQQEMQPEVTTITSDDLNVASPIRTLETLNSTKIWMTISNFRDSIGEWTWADQAKKEIDQKQPPANRTLKKRLEFYQSGWEWYNCCIITNDQITNDLRYCERFACIHPEYILDSIYYDDEILDHIPICANCKGNYTKPKIGTNQWRILPPRDSWPHYPEKVVRIHLSDKRNLLINYKIGKEFDTKFLEKNRLVELKEPKERKNYPKLTSVSAKKPGDKIQEGFVGDATLSPIFICNRGLKIRDRMKAAANKAAMDLLANAREIELFNRIIKNRHLNAMAIKDGKFNILNKIMESQIEPSALYSATDSVVSDVTIPALDNKTNLYYRLCLNAFPQFYEANAYDQSIIKRDYHYFHIINDAIIRCLSTDKVTESDISDGKFYSIPCFFNNWDLDGDVRAIANDFELDNKMNEESELLYVDAHYYLNMHFKKYQFLDWVGRFRLIRQLILYSRENGTCSGFEIQREFQPQIRYVLSHNRKAILSAMELKDMQNELIKCLPAADYTEYFTTENELIAFQNDYPNLSFIEQELVKRRYHSYCMGMGKLAKTDNEDQFVQKMRTYLFTQIVSNSDESPILMDIGTKVFCPEDDSCYSSCLSPLPDLNEESSYKQNIDNEMDVKDSIFGISTNDDGELLRFGFESEETEVD